MRKAYMYTLDAGIAVIILVAGFLVIAAMYLYAPDKERTETIGNDIAGLLSQATLDDVCQDYETCICTYPSIQDLCLQGKIRNRHVTLMELFGQLYHDNERQAIADIIDEAVIQTGIKPDKFEMQMLLIEPVTGKTAQLYELVIT